MSKLKRIVLPILGVAALVALAPPAWNIVATAKLQADYPEPGERYLVNGRHMHLFCSGSGSPTLLLEAGAHGDWLNWQKVQPQLSTITRVCSYDRAGHGWSQPRSGVRDAVAIANELHALLEAASIRGPIVLVGFSAGGLYVREFFKQFPHDVVGMALLDSSSPEQIDELPGWRQNYETNKREAARQLPWDRLRVWSGWERLMGNCSSDLPADLRHLSGYFDAENCRLAYVDEDDCEQPYFEDSTKEAARVESLGDIPLLIISHDPERSGPLEAPVWEKEQERLKSLSARSWRVIAKGATHALQQDRPDVDILELTRLVAYLRGGEKPDFGSTTTK